MKRFAAIFAALALLAGCAAVPDGTDAALVATSNVVGIVQQDQELETAEQRAFFEGLKQAERERLFSEQFDAVLGSIAITSDTASLKPEFVAYSHAVLGKIGAFDAPLDRWQARGAERAKRLGQVRAMQTGTIDALANSSILPPATATPGGIR